MLHSGTRGALDAFNIYSTVVARAAMTRRSDTREIIRESVDGGDSNFIATDFRRGGRVDIGTMDIFLEFDCATREGRPEKVLPDFATGEGVRLKRPGSESSTFFPGGLLMPTFGIIVIDGDLCPLVPIEDFLLAVRDATDDCVPFLESEDDSLLAEEEREVLDLPRRFDSPEPVLSSPKCLRHISTSSDFFMYA